jgi:hypothetical protein
MLGAPGRWGVGCRWCLMTAAAQVVLQALAIAATSSRFSRRTMLWAGSLQQHGVATQVQTTVHNITTQLF